jgi:hypothetical protein
LAFAEVIDRMMRISMATSASRAQAWMTARPRPDGGNDIMRSLLTMIVITAAVAACGGSAGPSGPQVECGQVATAYWDHQSAELNNCASQFGVPPLVHIRQGEVLAVAVAQDWVQRFPEIQSSNQAVLVRGGTPGGSPRAHTVVVAAFRAAHSGTAYVYAPEGSLPEAPCTSGQCSSGDQLILTKVSVTG